MFRDYNEIPGDNFEKWLDSLNEQREGLDEQRDKLRRLVWNYDIDSSEMVVALRERVKKMNYLITSEDERDGLYEEEKDDFDEEERDHFRKEERDHFRKEERDHFRKEERDHFREEEKDDFNENDFDEGDFDEGDVSPEQNLSRFIVSDKGASTKKEY
jgi:hypothetical protein